MRFIFFSFLIFFSILSSTLFSQEQYCWFSYKPNLSVDSLIVNEKGLKSVSIYQLVKLSKDSNDTIFIKQNSLSECENSILEDCFVKRSRNKKGKIIHIIEHKYSGNRYKLIHYYNSKMQISKTTNNLKKGNVIEDFMAFSKVKYEYNKEGLCFKQRFYLDGYTINGENYTSLWFKYNE